MDKMSVRTTLLTIPKQESCVLQFCVFEHDKFNYGC
jgi:hypothetical protein